MGSSTWPPSDDACAWRHISGGSSRRRSPPIFQKIAAGDWMSCWSSWSRLRSSAGRAHARSTTAPAVRRCGCGSSGSPLHHRSRTSWCVRASHGHRNCASHVISAFPHKSRIASSFKASSRRVEQLVRWCRSRNDQSSFSVTRRSWIGSRKRCSSPRADHLLTTPASLRIVRGSSRHAAFPHS